MTEKEELNHIQESRKYRKKWNKAQWFTSEPREHQSFTLEEILEL